MASEPSFDWDDETLGSTRRYKGGLRASDEERSDLIRLPKHRWRRSVDGHGLNKRVTDAGHGVHNSRGTHTRRDGIPRQQEKSTGVLEAETSLGCPQEAKQREGW